ncbi:MAG: YraN family protein [Phycisphaerales bacterium]|nr:YraN family protein [Phycisphaerales bacterium]
MWRLRLRGWRVLARNLRIGYDELDLVALAPGWRTLVVIEVKSACSRWPTMDRIDAAKFHRLCRAAAALPHQWRAGRRVRIDAALVRVGRFRCQVRWHRGLR